MAGDPSRWIIEKATGPKRDRRWRVVACSWSRHDAVQLMFREFGFSHRVRPLDSEWPQIFSGTGDYDKGEFD